MQHPRHPRVPKLSALQFLALGVILGGHEPGRAIREVLARHGERRTGAAFYQLMARLERDGLVEGWYEPIVVGGHPAKERCYRATRAGATAWRQARAFYETVAAAADRQLADA